MVDPKSLIFIHGLEGTSQGGKASHLRRLFPGMLIPDFPGTLQERMAALYNVLGTQAGWTIIGSSFGGLMGALFTCQRPAQVRKLVLLAPALILPEFSAKPPVPVSVPTIIYHGSQDTLIPIAPTRKLAEQVFLNLTYHIVDDDHGLYKTAQELDWLVILS
jgi:pimeloyl-ACP methyl ester carboxylesterase